LFKSNVPLSELFASVELDRRKGLNRESLLRQYNTVENEKLFEGDRFVLPKVGRRYQLHI